MVALLQRMNFMKLHKGESKLLVQDNRPLERTCLFKPLILSTQNSSFVCREQMKETQQTLYTNNFARFFHLNFCL